MSKDRNVEWNIFKELFRDSLEAINQTETSTGKSMPNVIKHFKLTQKDIRQRTEASIGYINEFCQKHTEYERDDIFPPISYIEGGGLYWPEELFEKENSPLSGASIWILDILRKHGKLEECCKIINNVDYNVIIELDSPENDNVEHYLYDRDLLNNLYTILYECYYNEPINTTVKGYWEQIRKLIPNEEIDKVYEVFKEIAELYCLCGVKASKNTIGQQSVNLSPLMNVRINEMDDIEEKEEELNRYSKLNSLIRLGMSINGIKEAIGYKLYSYIAPYFDRIYKQEIDIYGMCAVYFFIKERQDFLSKMCILPQLVFNTIFCLLPWHTSHLTNSMDNVKIDCRIKDSVDMNSYYAPYYPIYIQSYNDGAEYMANFAQYYYLKNEKILPYEKIMPSITDFEVFSKEKAEEFSNYDKYCSLEERKNELGRIGYNEEDDEDEEYDEEFEDEELDEDEKEKIDNVDDIESIKKENKELLTIIESLKKTINMQDRTNKVLEKKLAKVTAEYEKSHKTMAELNEAIFNRENEREEVEDKSSISVDLPYTANKKAIVFGGHATWLKSIKEKLKEVKFISDSVQFNVDMIRNADVVWIQTNAISHSAYYKIIDAVRLYDKPCHYFKFSSAIKCVEQFIAVDNN